ncbi:MAG: thymidine kinase [Deltaproteobacteria bacterium]|nr:thymidine kinase [Deltaproteobacteria bacterium]
MHTMPRDVGWIEVVCGSMFSGKTEELLRRVRRAQLARQLVQVFKPVLDRRYHETDIVTHEGRSIPSVPVSRATEILERVDARTRVVGIDEAQFFDEELVRVCEEMADRGLRVIVAGLDQDYRGRPFGPMPHLLCIAEYVTKNHAICVVCGNPANRSQRISGGQERVEIGAQDRYEARCRRCFYPEGEPDQAELFSEQAQA